MEQGQWVDFVHRQDHTIRNQVRDLGGGMVEMKGDSTAGETITISKAIVEEIYEPTER